MKSWSAGERKSCSASASHRCPHLPRGPRQLACPCPAARLQRASPPQAQAPQPLLLLLLASAPSAWPSCSWLQRRGSPQSPPGARRVSHQRLAQRARPPCLPWPSSSRQPWRPCCCLPSPRPPRPPWRPGGAPPLPGPPQPLSKTRPWPGLKLPPPRTPRREAGHQGSGRTGAGARKLRQRWRSGSPLLA